MIQSALHKVAELSLQRFMIVTDHEFLGLIVTLPCVTNNVTRPAPGALARAITLHHSADRRSMSLVKRRVYLYHTASLTRAATALVLFTYHHRSAAHLGSACPPATNERITSNAGVPPLRAGMVVGARRRTGGVEQ